MAKSPAHEFGQTIGNVLEASIEPLLRKFAQEHRLYLDKKGPRPARHGMKVSWTDTYGNIHDLDYVLERGGSDTQIGTPVAFIETAWRRYTKHSRNKAQEIQGAILPLVATHHNIAPFTGVILAGVFTEGALAQLKSLGFTILYFSYDAVVEAFKCVDIEARFDEKTPDVEFARKIRAWQRLSEIKRRQVAKALIEINSEAVKQFLRALNHVVIREIEIIRLLPLHGTPLEWHSVEEAIAYIKNYNEDNGPKPVVKYEIEIRYNNGDRIQGQFVNKESAIQFLSTFQRLPLRPA